MESEYKFLQETIEEVKEEICDYYCKYTSDLYKSLLQEQVDLRCKTCPLNRL